MLKTHVFLVIFCVTRVISNETSSNVSFNNALNVLSETLNKCNEKNFTLCLKVLALKSIDRILMKDSLQIVDGITLAKKFGGIKSRKTEEAHFLQQLQASSHTREEIIDRLIIRRLSAFFNMFSLNFDLQRMYSITAEYGRHMTDSGGSDVSMAVSMAGGIGISALKAIILIATKATLVVQITLAIINYIDLRNALSGKDDRKPALLVPLPHKKFPPRPQGHSFSSGKTVKYY